MTYSEKLRDPRWQKKRLEIMERDEFACLLCGDKQKTLNVHHSCYRSGVAPWEYHNNTLWTLCEDCHEEVAAAEIYIAESRSLVRPSPSQVLFDAARARVGEWLMTELPAGAIIDRYHATAINELFPHLRPVRMGTEFPKPVSKTEWDEWCEIDSAAETVDDRLDAFRFNRDTKAGG